MGPVRRCRRGRTPGAARGRGCPVQVIAGGVAPRPAPPLHRLEKAEGRLGPPASREALLRYRHFLHYAEGSMMPPLFALLVVNRLGLLGRPARAPLLRMFARHLDWLEDELGGRDWFAGDQFTAADIMMSFPLEAARSRAGLGDEYPNLIDWLESIHARPAYAAALQKGGPYAYA